MEADRVDLLAIKQQMAAGMSSGHGKTYWTAMQRFFSGKLTRTELEQVLDKLLPTSDLVALHNKLLQGVLLNTTRAALPPPGRHTGWNSRSVPDDEHQRRDGSRDDEDVSPVERKRRKLKHTVLRVGKYERAQIKAMTKLQKPKKPTLLDELDSQGPQLLPNGLPVALEGVAHPSATLQQDYLRALAAPLCCESRFLPSVDEMRDRMSLIAYEAGLADGVDARAALLLNEAIELHLKSILSSLFTLMRNSKERSRADVERKIRTNDCEALFDMTPSLASQPHLGTIERLLALPPPAPQSDEELDLDSPEATDDDDDGGAEAEQQRAGDIEMKDTNAELVGVDKPKTSLSRRSSGKRPARSSLRPRASSSSLSGTVAPKREALLIDPSVPGLAKPQHPDLVSPVPFVSSGRPDAILNGSAIEDGSATNTLTNGAAPSALSSIGVAKSERDLQAELFPESATSTGSPAPAHPHHQVTRAGSASQQLHPQQQNGVGSDALGHSSMNGTAAERGGGHTSDGSSDDERKDGANENASSSLAGQQAGANASLNRKKKKRRALWEVVDSVKLLDGILD